MATKRKPITFNVCDETYNRVKSIFPEMTGREENLNALLEAYETPEPAADLEAKKYRALIENLCTTCGCTADELEAHFAENKEKLQTCSDEARRFGTANGLLMDEITDLQQKIEIQNAVIDENNKTDWAKIRVTLQPFALALLEETAEKLSIKYGRTVLPMQIMVDMFMRYTIEHWTQWFFPFVLSDGQIVAIANQINPDIQSMNQIKKTLPK